MYLLYATITTACISYVSYKLISYLYFPKKRFFLEEVKEDEYTLFCYRIFYKDSEETIITEDLEVSELLEMNEDKPINKIIIDYMYNGLFMKYITYDLNVDFPLYETNVKIPSGAKFPTKFLINDEDVTHCFKPFLGPKNNFYLDKNTRLTLEDIFMDHPEKDKININEGIIEIHDTANNIFVHPLPWTPVWKTNTGEADNSKFLTDYILLNKSNSQFGITYLNKDVIKKL